MVATPSLALLPHRVLCSISWLMLGWAGLLGRDHPLHRHLGLPHTVWSSCNLTLKDKSDSLNKEINACYLQKSMHLFMNKSTHQDTVLCQAHIPFGCQLPLYREVSCVGFVASTGAPKIHHQACPVPSSFPSFRR